MENEDYTYAVVDVSKKKKSTQKSTNTTEIICPGLNMTEICLKEASFSEETQSIRIPEIESTTTVIDSIRGKLSSKMNDFIDMKKSANVSSCTIASVVAITVLSLVLFVCIVSLSAEISKLKSEISGTQALSNDRLLANKEQLLTTLNTSILEVIDQLQLQQTRLNLSIEQKIAALRRSVAENMEESLGAVDSEVMAVQETLSSNITLLFTAIEAISNKVSQYEAALNASVADSHSHRLLINASFSLLENRIGVIELEVNRVDQLTPVATCSALIPSAPSGYYWVRASNGSAVRVYCDMTRSCGNVTGGWMRVAQLDMTNSSHQCPSGLNEHTYSNIRTCVNANTSASCSANTFFDTFNVSYSKVCGKVIGYQKGSTNGFVSRQYIIDTFYVDGVSLTHGSPRQHIWTFSAARDMVSMSRCPGMGAPPVYVGGDYFCDTGATAENSVESSTFFSGNPLWDCEDESMKCDSSSPPWFYKQLPQPTTDNIEMRVCRDESAYHEDVAIETVEIFIM